MRNGAASNAEIDDGCDATAVLLKKGTFLSNWDLSHILQYVLLYVTVTQQVLKCLFTL